MGAPLLSVDIERSLVVLDGRSFPAVGLICPDHPTNPAEDRTDRLLGNVLANDVYLFVPLESGALVSVALGRNRNRYRLDASLHARTCEEDLRCADDPLYLPRHLTLEGRSIRYRPNTWATWFDCDPDWLAEHIQRLSTFEYRQPSGPPCELVSVADAMGMLAS